ncbi:hypothetical protein [Aurantiacibacter spongiae]|uniref:Uncharacterized protein n=1 Tax=Aurantiacibacter spongiae TaxID=2488860 RepID=A0A3N5CPS7_9SPHN|nr:hypothetical protein [Aurantiacibacter spongiae]RPF70366.1 hypothetical protein EG799_01000 [Aurantiacibacter spongiae]
MHAVLISSPSSDADIAPVVAGRTVAERQLLFANEIGCERVFFHGSGASPASIAARRQAERLGMRFEAFASSHALIAAVGDDDSLLVLQPGLLPEARTALELLRAQGNRVLVVSAGPGAAAGFERIDLDRAWAGAMKVPGRMLDRLRTLPEDAAPVAAILRIALQNRLPEARLQDDILDSGRWSVVANRAAAQARERDWLRTHMGEGKAGAISPYLASTTLMRFGASLLASDRAIPAIAIASVVLLGGAILAATRETPVVAFALLAFASPVVELLLEAKRLARAPFGSAGRWPLLRRLLDLALLATAILAIDGLWYREAFPPFVLLAGLILSDRHPATWLTRSIGDRGLVAVLCAVLSAILLPEIAVIIAATLVLVARLVDRSGQRG